ncbi:hypothetical protein PO909_013321 [Leuciscus waleckii]
MPNSNLSLPDRLVNNSFFPGNESDFGLEIYPHNSTNHGFDQTSSVVITFVYFVVCAVGLCGNTLVIYVILRYAKMKTVTNIYILNLAVADVLCMLSLPFIAIQLLLLHWPFGSAICRVVLTADSMNQFTSIFFLTVIGVNLKRYEARTCTMLWPEPQNTYYTAFIFYTFFLGFFLPLIVISMCYLLIVIKVKSSGMRVGSTKRKRSERKVTRMVSIVVVVFVLCWLPFYVFNVTSVTGTVPTTPVLKSTFDFVVVLGYANSCANPILYAFLSDNFKKSFQNVLCLKRVGGLDEIDRSDSRQDRTRMVNDVMTETQNAALLNGNLQTSI